MSRGASVAVLFVRRWVSVYTFGLEPDVREERRAEMASDLWEHQQAGGLGLRTTIEILVRSLLGSPADVSWRLEQAQAGERLSGMILGVLAWLEAAAGWVVRRGLPGLAVLLGWAYLAGGALLLVAAPFRESGAAGFAFVGGWGVLAGLSVRWGRGAVANRPGVGFAAVFVGALPLGLLLMVTVVVPVLASLVCVIEGRRAWRSGPR